MSYVNRHDYRAHVTDLCGSKLYIASSGDPLRGALSDSQVDLHDWCPRGDYKLQNNNMGFVWLHRYPARLDEEVGSVRAGYQPAGLFCAA